jgi:hypothetical protein
VTAISRRHIEAIVEVRANGSATSFPHSSAHIRPRGEATLRIYRTDLREDL